MENLGCAHVLDASDEGQIPELRPSPGRKRESSGECAGSSSRRGSAGGPPLPHRNGLGKCLQSRRGETLPHNKVLRRCHPCVMIAKGHSPHMQLLWASFALRHVFYLPGTPVFSSAKGVLQLPHADVKMNFGYAI